MSEPDEDEAVALAHRLLDLARAGSTEALAAYVDAGVSVNLTDPAGNTLVMLAAYHGHPSTVAALVAAGADASAGSPSALATAQFFNQPDLVALLR